MIDGVLASLIKDQADFLDPDGNLKAIRSQVSSFLDASRQRTEICCSRPVKAEPELRFGAAPVCATPAYSLPRLPSERAPSHLSKDPVVKSSLTSAALRWTLRHENIVAEEMMKSQ